MNPEPLFSRSRSWIATLVVICAIAQAAAAAAAVQAMSHLLDRGVTLDAERLTPIVVAILAAGLATVGERWLGERLAQSFVSANRRKLFEAVIGSARGTRESRWLTPFVTDLAALRNWAAQGPIRLATSGAACLVASVWLLVSMPHLALATLPVALSALLIVALARPMRKMIAAQRAARGRLTRFSIRRIRAEVTGKVRANQHGRKGLVERDRELVIRSVARGRMAGLMDAAALSGGLAASLVLVVVAAGDHGATPGEIVGGLALLGFITARLSELSRAFQAYLAGTIAIARISRLLAGSTGKPGDDDDE